MNLWGVFLTGLLAGGASCAAMQGGLLIGVIARHHPHPGEATKPVVGNEKAPAMAATNAASVGSKPSGSASPRRGGKNPSPPLPQQTVRERLGEDVAPVTGFLLGKLASHMLLGFVLGFLGSLVKIDSRISGFAQIAAGVLVVLLALAQLGVPGFRGFVVTPPQSWSRLARSSARSQSMLAPALLGLATVLIPCGITLSMALLAATSGSPLYGAAIMGVFVLGTAPLFAVLGVVARRSAVSLRGRLSIAVGVVVLVIGLVTVNSGLAVAGSPLTAQNVTKSLSGGPASAPESSVVTVAAGIQTIAIDASSGAYTPRSIAAKSGLPTTLMLHTLNTRGCGTYFVVPSKDVQQVLPATGDTPISLGVLEPGTVEFTCGMGMYNGTITVT